MKQLPTRNKVSLSMDGWTSTNRLAIRSVIAYCLDQNGVMQEVQLAFDEVYSQFIPYFNS